MKRPWGNLTESLEQDGDSNVVRVGLDVGSHTTVFQSASRLGDLLVPRTQRIPTWLAYPGDEQETPLLGVAALGVRGDTPLVHPLESGSTRALTDFAEGLRRIIDPEGQKDLWAVLSCPRGTSAEDLKRLRIVSSQIFERTSLLDPALLMATSFGSHEVARHSIWVDLGATSVRVSPVHGGSMDAGETRIVPGGGNAVDRRLAGALAKRYPGLLLSRVTVTRIKDRFAHVHPVALPAKLRISFDGEVRRIEVSSIVREACEPLVDEILTGLRGVLGSCPSDTTEEMLGNIVVAGGGSRMAGIETRLREELRQEFGQVSNVTVPQEPTFLAANGALRWAHFLREEEWEIPIFSFAP